MKKGRQPWTHKCGATEIKVVTTYTNITQDK